MAISSKRIRVVVIFAAAFFVAYLIASSMRQTQQKYEVCVTFQAGSHCSTASGATSDEAIRSAQQIDCELLSHSREENMVCLDRQPASVKRMY